MTPEYFIIDGGYIGGKWNDLQQKIRNSISKDLGRRETHFEQDPLFLFVKLKSYLLQPSVSELCMYTYIYNVLIYFEILYFMIYCNLKMFNYIKIYDIIYDIYVLIMYLFSLFNSYLYISIYI